MLLIPLTIRGARRRVAGSIDARWSDLRVFTQIAAAGDGSYYQKGLRPGYHPFGQRSIRRFVRQILLAGKKSHKRAPLLVDLIAQRSAQHRIASLQRVEDRALRHRTLDIERY